MRMNHKVLLTGLFFLFVSPVFVHAISAPELVVDDKLKQCRTYQPMAGKILPEGWQPYSYTVSPDSKQTFTELHKRMCEKMNYSYAGHLEGSTNNEYYLMLIVYVLLINLIFLAIIAFIIGNFKKVFITKKRKIIAYLIFIFFVNLILYFLLTNFIS